MKQKILLTCIFKDDSEYEIVERMLDSFMPHMSGLCVALTGVSGEFSKLKELIKRYNGAYVVCSEKTHPELYMDSKFANFAEARNICFNLASKLQEKTRYDWWSWADADDILVSGEELQTVAQKAQDMGMDEVFFTYWYAIQLREDRTFDESCVMIEHLRERLLKPNMFKWVSRLHEVCVPKEDGYQPKYTAYDYDAKEERFLTWAHITDEDRVYGAMERNIKILELQAKEQQRKDPRTLFYLAKTYFDLNTPQNDTLSEELLKEYLYGAYPSGWPEERSNACEYIGNIYVRRGDHRQAIDWFHKAIQEYGNRHMPYLLLAREYAEVGDIEQSNFWLDTAVKMDAPNARTTIGNPMQIKYFAASLMYNKAIREMKLDEAIKWAAMRNQIIDAQDDGLLKTLHDAKALNEAAKNLFLYAKWLKDKGHTKEIRHLLEAVAPEMANEPFVQYLANEVQEAKTWGKNSIVYYGSWGAPHFEEWDEKSLDKGIGGSETAIIKLSQEWAKLGYQVTVFAECTNHIDEFGVHWKHWSQINWNDTFNVLILWRSPHLLDKDIKARKLFMDLHDITNQLDYTEERMNKLDGIFFKSNWHRSHVPKLANEKARVISNGI